MLLGELVERSAERGPERTLLVFRDRTYSYGELADAIARFAGGLRRLGLREGERVGLLAHNLPEFIIAYYAILRLGGIVVPLNVMLKPNEIAYILNDSAAAAVVTVEPFLPGLQAARGDIPSLRLVVARTQQPQLGVTPWEEVASGDPLPSYPGCPDDTAVICYTSGTTGHPKGAMLSHGNLIANCEQCKRMERQMISQDDRVLLVLPLFHIYAMNVGLNMTVMQGATAVMLERFDPVGALEVMQRHRVTVLYGAPPMYVAWANLPTFKDYDLSSLRVAVSGAAALPVQILEQFQRLTGVQIMEGYGLTEVSPVATTNAAGTVTKPGSIGRAIPDMELRIVDMNDHDVPVGEVGEIVLRGPNVMKGYYNQEAATAEAFRNGWFHTGDMARMDEDGYIYIVDRKKDMINVGGFNVYPREVEETLFRHPKVADAAVVGVPDPYQGESVLAILVLKPGEQATEQEIIDWAREQMAVFKAPRRVEFRTELPKLPTGKVLRRALRDEARARYGAPAAAPAEAPKGAPAD